MLSGKPVSTLLCRVTAISSLFISVSVWACSDLPNICEQHEQVHQQNMENARIAAEEYAEQQEEAREARIRTDQGMWEPNEPDYMKARMDAVMDVSRMAVANAEKTVQLHNDPKFQAYLHGTWEFFQDKVNAKPGEYCAAFFWKKEGMVRISGPGEGYQGALLTFWGKDIPRPNQIEKVKVTLSQTNEQPQTVEALNYSMQGYEYGAIALVVPSIDAALAGIEDVQHFDLAMNGKSVIDIEWHSGLAARNKLKQCVNAKP